ncbi:hypothetical protein [Aerosticca soli]|jgi:hypothetical protein|uniref:hypothetical protein n=1 Tax=Aerosticca soli TaxID=2010829 RepID=UPI000F843B83|nr:hypothetical protein [Aerosticca soli]
MNPILSPRAARNDYPHTWDELKARIAEAKRATDAEIIPLGATIIEIEGVSILEVMCVTDLVADDAEMPATGMRFRVPLRDPLQSQQVH